MSDKLYIVLITIHGLVRGEDIELGRDADTGGQIKYVIELAKELGKQEQVGQVDVLTRQVFDPKVHEDYSRPQEKIGQNAYIVRLPCGPKRYLRKEVLWPHLESFIDQALQYFRRLEKIPDIIHGHYADAGYVGSILANLLEVPFVFTGHSLGREKKRRLLEKGLSEETIKERYNIGYRIEAEERALNVASLVIASTNQEVNEQYEQYEHYEPSRMMVIPPGVDLSLFYFLEDYQPNPDLIRELARFLTQPDKPIILAISRADERKNITALVQAYGENPALQALANLVIVAGSRDNIQTMDRSARQVLTNLLLTIDRYDLYGKVAYPKHSKTSDIPEYYRLALATGGVFVNPALTEPFGLTLIEAGAMGLPLVATHDGGPTDIILNCQNGLLIDPLDTKTMGETILTALSDRERWQQWSQNGIEGVQRYYAWTSHAQTYLGQLEKVLTDARPAVFHKARGIAFSDKFPITHRVIITDIDDTLLGDPEALSELFEYLGQAGDRFIFGIATGRTLDSALNVLNELDIPIPYVFITSVGSEIYYSQRLVMDHGWKKHINYRWQPNKIKQALAAFEGLTLQPEEEQREFKLSYFIDSEQGITRQQIVRHLRQQHFVVNVVYSFGQYLDILPIRASKGLAIRHLGLKWGLSMENFLVAGSSGNDEEMLKGDTYGVVVSNYSAELEKLRGRPRIYFAEQSYAKGIMEGIQHFGFLDNVIREEG